MDDVTPLLDSLNAPQREAVSTDASHTLVLAGAGSGKTRVLVHRIAWLLSTGQAQPYHILAVTFTNKAANEMRGRIESLVSGTGHGLWVGTFHSLSHRLLRMHWEQARLPQQFHILDSDDQVRQIKLVMRQLALDEKIWNPQQAGHFINSCKDESKRPAELYAADNDVWTQQMIRVYAAYEEACQRSGVVDFAELLLRSYELLGQHKDLLTHYHQRFRFILVDEFQDTNTIQYLWLQRLAGDTGRLFIVGDDDQSIYGWRGAKIRNIQQLPEQYPGTQLVRLEQNYRSSGMILAAANALIAKNSERLGKNLWTEGEDGEPVHVYRAFSETDEAAFVAERVQDWSGQRADIAVLYRTSSQSRAFEEAFLSRSIPYRIYGGIRFYERAEIKDVLAYLRLLMNPQDDGAFERIVNTPKRNLGDRTLEALRAIARQDGISLWQASNRALMGQVLPARAANSLNAFLQLFEQSAAQIQELPLHEQVDVVVKRSGLLEHYYKSGKENGQRRQENLEELVSAARQFEKNHADSENLLLDFLTQASLEAGERQGGSADDCVQMMTLHLAKGLEFDMVFLCGLEEDLFPHKNSMNEGGLEEERRLCYVGMTRARRQLYLCHSDTRYRYGQRDFSAQSRFIQEIPAELREDVRLQTPSALSSPSTTSPSTALGIGDRVMHQKFGDGIVLKMEGQGAYARVQVRFDNVGSKWLVLGYAGLQKCG